MMSVSTPSSLVEAAMVPPPAAAPENFNVPKSPERLPAKTALVASVLYKTMSPEEATTTSSPNSKVPAAMVKAPLFAMEIVPSVSCNKPSLIGVEGVSAVSLIIAF